MGVDLVTRRFAIALILVSVTSVIATIGLLAVPSLRMTFASGTIERRGYVVGEGVDVPPAQGTATGTRVLIFVSSHCEACRKSRAALSQIVASAQAGGVAVSLVTAREQPESHNEFARAIGLSPSAVQRLDLSRLRLRAVPTVVVVTSAGAAQYVHEGVVTDADAAAATAAVRRAQPSGL